MSAADTTVPGLLQAWREAAGSTPRFKVLPGLVEEALQVLASTYPGHLTRERRALLRTAAGLVGTAIGDVDFTGLWYPEEPLPVFRPCLTLSVDECQRRWIAETDREHGLPGPIWCLLPSPAVALCVSEELSAFLFKLHEAHTSSGLASFFRSLYASARTIWNHRLSLAACSQLACEFDRGIRGWLFELPAGAYVYDLRDAVPARGWPYGMAGPKAELFRCGRLPIFAVAAGGTAG